MRRVQLVLVFSIVCVLVAWERPANGQRASRYRPARQTLSPWFGLYNRESAPLGNYHSYVRPKQQLYNTLWQQHSNLRRQDASIRALGQQVSGTKQRDAVRPTGTSSTFMNYSHYFPSQ